jgi:hypothetical protein
LACASYSGREAAVRWNSISSDDGRVNDKSDRKKDLRTRGSEMRKERRKNVRRREQRLVSNLNGGFEEIVE